MATGSPTCAVLTVELCSDLNASLASIGWSGTSRGAAREPVRSALAPHRFSVDCGLFADFLWWQR